MGTLVHPTSVVDDDVVLGDGTRVWHFCHIQSGARIGADCVLGQNVYVGPGTMVGDQVHIQNNVSVYKGVELGDGVFVGPSAVFTNVRFPRATYPRKDEFARTPVGRGASIGANATVVCGTRLGEYSMVGAGSVVSRDVVPHALVVGVPARQVGWVCRCGERLVLDAEPGQASCDRCGDRYSLDPVGPSLTRLQS